MVHLLKLLQRVESWCATSIFLKPMTFLIFNGSFFFFFLIFNYPVFISNIHLISHIQFYSFTFTFTLPTFSDFHLPRVTISWWRFLSNRNQSYWFEGSSIFHQRSSCFGFNLSLHFLSWLCLMKQSILSKFDGSNVLLCSDIFRVNWRALVFGSFKTSLWHFKKDRLIMRWPIK